GWSRGGAPVALLFSFIVALGLTVGEGLAFSSRQYGTGVATILALPAARAALFDATTYPLLPTLRNMVMYTLMLAGLVMIIESVRHIAYKIAPRRFIMAPRPACGGSLRAVRRPPTVIEVKTLRRGCLGWRSSRRDFGRASAGFAAASPGVAGRFAPPTKNTVGGPSRPVPH